MGHWQSKKIIQKSRYRSKDRKYIGRWLITAIILLTIFYVIFFILPRVDIAVIPKSRIVQLEETITLDLKNQAGLEKMAEKTLIAKEVFITGKAEEIFETSGEKNIGERAKGEAEFINLTGITYNILVEDGLETIDGIIFTITSPLTIPAAIVSADGEIIPGKIISEIVALDPGEVGNIAPQKIFIQGVAPDKQHKIFAQNQQALKGGSSEIVKVISQEDIKSAQTKLELKLQKELLNKINDKLNEDESLIKETFKLTDKEFTSEVGVNQELEEFSLGLTAKGKAVIYKNKNLTNLIKNLLLSQITPQEEFLGDEPKELEIVKIDTDSAGNILLSIKSSWLISQPIDLTSIKQSLLGKREAEARRIILNMPTVADVRFDWNFALSRKIPSINSHVNLTIGK